jgi:hypothetical protein
MSKEKEYAVDSTRGSSLINPINYKGDVLVQVWIDSRMLATITRWMDSKGNYPKFMSQAVRRPLEVLTGFLVDSDEVEMVDDTAEARKMLERRFNIDLNRGGRGTKNVMHNMALSDRRGELGDRIGKEQKIFDVYKPKRVTNQLSSQVIDKYKELFPDNENIEVNRNNPIIKEKMSPDEVIEAIRKIDAKAQRELDELNNLDLSTLKPVKG